MRKKKKRRKIKVRTTPVLRRKVRKVVYNSAVYKKWRAKVFERDLFTCQMCGKKGGYLEAHHIFPKAKYPKLVLVISNGITLCKKCHIKVTGKELKYVDRLTKILKDKKRCFNRK